jgi:hypothetical protein
LLGATIDVFASMSDEPLTSVEKIMTVATNVAPHSPIVRVLLEAK